MTAFDESGSKAREPNRDMSEAEQEHNTNMGGGEVFTYCFFCLSLSFFAYSPLRR